MTPLLGEREHPGPRVTRRGEVESLVAFIASSKTGRTRTEISSEHFGRNKTAEEITALLADLIRDGRVGEQREQPPGGRGRPATRYFAC